MTYTEVDAGGAHSLLLKSDGTVTACGRNDFLQCDIPALEADMQYTQVSAGALHTLLLKSDGTVVACGRTNAFCDGVPWSPDIPPGPYSRTGVVKKVLQAFVKGKRIIFRNLASDIVFEIEIDAHLLMLDLHRQLASAMHAHEHCVDAIFVEPDLSDVTLSSFAQDQPWLEVWNLLEMLQESA